MKRVRTSERVFRQAPQRAGRRGAAMVEAAIVLPSFLLLILGMLELSMLVYRYNWVSEAARQCARHAIVHGDLASPKMNTWGPTQFQASATETDKEIVSELQGYLIMLDPNVTTITVDWLDGDTEVGSRVRCTISTQHQAFLTFPFGGDSWTFDGVSTMEIAH